MTCGSICQNKLIYLKYFLAVIVQWGYILSHSVVVQVDSAVAEDVAVVPLDGASAQKDVNNLDTCFLSEKKWKWLKFFYG